MVLGEEFGQDCGNGLRFPMTTFFPLTQYPPALQFVVKLTPLYQGVALERGLCLGQLQWTMLVNVAYLLVMGTLGVRIASRRLRMLLQP